jgi:predicted transcriptional regulator of viral defense system
MKKYLKLAQVRALLADMEGELGLSELSAVERDVLYAFTEAAERRQTVATRDVMSHPLVTPISRPTIFRAIDRLKERGLLKHVEGRERGLYVLTD